jgi:putative FmdB family regulatory protein
MPNYIYQCENKHRIELNHSIRESPDITCEECQTPMSRKPQVTSIEFKGSGFYSRDSRDA